MVEQDTMCLLDFYVHKSLQRRGIGFDLFKLALKVRFCETKLGGYRAYSESVSL